MFIGSVVLVGVITIAGLIGTANYFDFVGASVQIEQLREDITKVDVQSNEDVMGQATEWNQAIRAWRRYNQVPLVCIFVPNGWDEIELIEIK